MACIEHECGDCGEIFMDNNSGGRCPTCGSHDVSSFFDEESGASEPEEQDEDLSEIRAEIYEGQREAGSVR